MTREDIDRIASEYFDDKESEHEMDEVFDLAKKTLEERREDILDKIRPSETGGEVMSFPNTFDEYAEQYQIIDTEEVYTNKVALIPVFRVEQWLEHEMSAEQYRQRIIQAFHNADCDELIAVAVLPTEKEFEHLEWLLKNHYKKEPCEGVSDINVGNIYECSCGYGWDKTKVVRHHFCPNCGRAVEPSYNSIKTELKPCEDAISRQAAIDAIRKNTFRLTFAEEQGCEGHVAWSAEAVYSDVIEGALLELPPVTPQAKTGHWIYDRTRDWDGECKYECSECGMGSDVDYAYCMRCGAKME